MANKNLDIKHLDLYPVLQMTLQDTTVLTSPVPVDLTNATEARFLMSSRNTGLKVNEVMTIADQTDPANLGIVSYAWQEGDTDTTGSFTCEIQVMWPGSKPQTFPSKGYFTVTVGKDLGPPTGPGGSF